MALQIPFYMANSRCLAMTYLPWLKSVDSERTQHQPIFTGSNLWTQRAAASTLGMVVAASRRPAFQPSPKVHPKCKLSAAGFLRPSHGGGAGNV